MKTYEQQLIDLSRYAGARFDLTQAGGGNSSVKLDNGEMIIKASGFLLSQVCADKGYSRLDLEKVKQIFHDYDLLAIKNKRDKERKVLELIKAAVLNDSALPSIETLLHSLLYRYTLHTHPILVNALLCRKDWLTICDELFDNKLTIPYKTPGGELAFALKDSIDNYLVQNGEKPRLIFIQNHGLIVSSDNYEDVIKITEDTIDKIAEYFACPMERYKNVTAIAELMNSFQQDHLLAYLTDDQVIKDLVTENNTLLFTRPFCPGKYEYCGINTCKLDFLSDGSPIQAYLQAYAELPKVIVYQNSVYLISTSILKAKEMEEVLKAHLLELKIADTEHINYLSNAEINYLKAWEVNQYRRIIDNV
jgi:rhamnose utilization protein RhaD (predicted bifunctional aldolase and dehydrogenase)